MRMSKAQTTASLWVWLVLLLPLRVMGQAPIYKVCLVQNPGFANCTPGGDPTTFSGFEIDLLSLVAENIGWQMINGTAPADPVKPGYQLICTSLRVPAVVNILINATDPAAMADAPECDLGMGAFTVTSARVQNGTRFSWPHLHTSLGVMVASDSQHTSYDRWAFLKPFSRHIWVAVLCTTMITPVLLSLYENIIQTGRVPVGKNLLTEWRHAMYIMFLCCFNLQVLEVLSLPCQLMVVCFAFTNLIIVASYTANLAAVLTAAAVSTGIQTVQDLVNKNVAAHAVYVDRLLKNERIRATPYSWAGEPFFLQVKQQLVDGSLDAYIFDRPILQYYMGTDDPTCQLRLLSDTQVEPFDYGVAFNKQLPESLVANFSLGVLQVQATGLLPVLEERYLSGAASACNAESSYDNALQFGQVSGLYIILGSAAGLGLLVSMYSIWWHHIWRPAKHKRKMRRKQAEAEAKRQNSVRSSAGSSSRVDLHVYADCDPNPGQAAPAAGPTLVRMGSMAKRTIPLGAAHQPMHAQYEDSVCDDSDAENCRSLLNGVGSVSMRAAAAATLPGDDIQHYSSHTAFATMAEHADDAEAGLEMWRQPSSHHHFCHPHDPYTDPDDTPVLPLERYTYGAPTSGTLLPTTLPEEVSGDVIDDDDQQLPDTTQQQQQRQGAVEELEPGTCTAAVAAGVCTAAAAGKLPPTSAPGLLPAGSIGAALHGCRTTSTLLSDEMVAAALTDANSSRGIGGAEEQLPTTNPATKSGKGKEVGSRWGSVSSAVVAAKRLAQKVFVVEGKQQDEEVTATAPLAFTHALAAHRATSMELAGSPPGPSSSLVSVSKVQSSFIRQHARSCSGSLHQQPSTRLPAGYGQFVDSTGALYPVPAGYHIPGAPHTYQHQGSLQQLPGRMAGGDMGAPSARQLHHAYSMPASDGSQLPDAASLLAAQRMDSSRSGAAGAQLYSSGGSSSGEHQLPHVAVSADGRLYFVPVETVLPPVDRPAAPMSGAGAFAAVAAAAHWNHRRQSAAAGHAGHTSAPFSTPRPRRAGSSQLDGSEQDHGVQAAAAAAARRSLQSNQYVKLSSSAGPSQAGPSKWAQMLARGSSSKLSAAQAAAAAAAASNSNSNGSAAGPGGGTLANTPATGLGVGVAGMTSGSAAGSASSATASRQALHAALAAAQASTDNSAPGSAVSSNGAFAALQFGSTPSSSFRAAASTILMRSGSGSSATGMSRSSSGRGTSTPSSVMTGSGVPRSGSGRALAGKIAHLLPHASPPLPSGMTSTTLEGVAEEGHNSSVNSSLAGRTETTLLQVSAEHAAQAVPAAGGVSGGKDGAVESSHDEDAAGSEDGSAASLSFLPHAPVQAQGTQAPAQGS